MSRAVAIAASLLALSWASAVGRSAPAPAPPSTRAAAHGDTGPVRAAACGACHAGRYEEWTQGRHSRMLQPASARTALGDFSRTRLTLRGKAYRLRVADGEIYITESALSGKPVEHHVDYTLGNRRIQHYLTTIDRGRIIVLPPTWDVERREWFDSVEIIRPDEGVDNPVQQWNKNCVGCHVSQQDNRYSPATRTYATTWADFGTSCERCHGPGDAHAAISADLGPAAAARSAIVRPTRLDAAASTMVCAQCHSLRDTVAPGFRAGEDYYDYFVPKLEYTPRKEQDPVYWADGRPRRFSNDAIGLWQSRCFVEGALTCTTCHDAHRPDVDRHPELAPDNNALCTSCHASIARTLDTHTRHAPGSPGSSCVECHMPRTVVSIKARIRDHSMSLPTPENTVAFGIPNACTECHQTRSPAWAVEVMAKWWPNGRRTRAIERARAFSAARMEQPGALHRVLAVAEDPQETPVIRANALGYLRRYADPRAEAALVRALQSGDPLLRMVAAASFQHSAMHPALWRALDDGRRSVRLSALVSIVNGGGRPATEADRVGFARVSGEFAAQARMHEDDPTTQTDLGLVHLLNGDFDRAAEALLISRALQPEGARPAFLLGLVRLSQRRPDEARKLFEEIPRLDVLFPAARQQLQTLRTR